MTGLVSDFLHGCRGTGKDMDSVVLGVSHACILGEL